MSQPEYHGEEYLEEPRQGMSTGAIVAIIAVILFVVVGLPILICSGLFLAGAFTVNRGLEEVAEQSNKSASEDEARERQILAMKLQPVLFDLSKDDVSSYGEIPGSRKWTGRQVEYVDDDVFAVTGRVEYGRTVRRFRCEYEADNPKTAGKDDWKLKRIVIDGKDVGP